jgi:protein involved in polysaccharide export with SLBB domain
MIFTKPWQSLALAVVLTGLVTSSAVVAQSRGQVAGSRNFESRAELESHALAAEAAGRDSEARLIRYRLERGDFQDGDRILLTVQGPGGFSDTLTVRSGKQLELPQIAALPLDGVLRSELLPRLSAHLSKYLRNPVVIVRPLLRVGILGQVVRPGYYYASADLPISDVLMSAGGPAQDADISKVSIRRGGRIIIDERETRSALSAGRSMDMLHMQAGDEIQVGKERQYNWPIIVSSATGLLGLLFAITR